MNRRAWLVILLVGATTFGASAAHAGTDGRLQIGINSGADTGPYRGGGTGWGYGFDAGWHLSPRWGVFGIFDIGTSDRGDADPISRIAIEARARWVFDGSSTRTTTSTLRGYVMLGAGAGIVAYPLAHLDGALVTVPIELGIELGEVDRWNLGLAMRERAMLTIGSGDPAASFLNRIGPVIWLRF